MDLQKYSYEDLLSSIRERAIEFDEHLDRVKRVNQELVCKSEKAISTLKELLGTVRNKPTKTCPVIRGTYQPAWSHVGTYFVSIVLKGRNKELPPDVLHAGDESQTHSRFMCERQPC